MFSKKRLNECQGTRSSLVLHKLLEKLSTWRPSNQMYHHTWWEVKTIGKKITAGANFSSQALGARCLTGPPNQDCSLLSWFGDQQGASSRRRTAGCQTDSDQTDSSLPTPNCASCHKKGKELLTLSFVLFAYSFISQMLFLCHFPLNVISYFRACG